MSLSTYDKHPVVSVPGSASQCVRGWEAIAARLRGAVEVRRAPRTVLVVDCYPGVSEAEVGRQLATRLQPALCLHAAEALRPPASIDSLVAPFLGGDDPVFGFLSPLPLPAFFDADRVAAMRGQIESIDRGLVLAVGCGARLLHPGDILVYADLARWEAQLRFRRGESGNLGARNHSASAPEKYKRAYFVDWRVGDRWKQPLLTQWDFLLDTHASEAPKLAAGEAVRRGWRQAVSRPFRVVPLFDPAPWGGQWMRSVCGLDHNAPNFGWGFDCVPEENSLRLEIGGEIVELPSLDLVLAHPRALLGDSVVARFGAEFPIRFDFLDTMGGGNLSLQVHPRADYLRRHFGLGYTQDESYYLLDAGPQASVFLGLRAGVDRWAMGRALRAAQRGGPAFPAEEYVTRWPAKKHDHFLIPAGTVHASGAQTMVLEISATPYIFTFKLWDWGRLGLDGRPRPIHLDHGLANIQWDRDAAWAAEHLVNRVTPLAHGDGWREERTGLHESQFIETRRHWFTGSVPHDTGGGVNVLNLVEGPAAVVESPVAAFEPFPVHYAETFIVPAAVGPYRIRPLAAATSPLATLKAYVRP